LTTPGETNANGRGPGAAPDAHPLVALQELLAAQLEQAKGGQVEKVESTLDRVESLLREALASGRASGPRGSAPVDDVRLVGEVRRLYNELCLILAAGKGELTRRKKRAKTGRRCLVAYGRAPGGQARRRAK